MALYIKKEYEKDYCKPDGNFVADDSLRIDIAFLPCNQPYTMTTDQLIRAAKAIKPKVLFPYHYGQTDVTQIPAQLKATGIDVKIRHYE